MITGSSKYNKRVYVSSSSDSSIRVAFGASKSNQASDEHLNQVSFRQSGEHPSSPIIFPSSHSSPGLITPSPHIGLHTVSTSLPSGSSRIPL